MSEFGSHPYRMLDLENSYDYAYIMSLLTKTSAQLENHFADRGASYEEQFDTVTQIEAMRERMSKMETTDA